MMNLNSNIEYIQIQYIKDLVTLDKMVDKLNKSKHKSFREKILNHKINKRIVRLYNTQNILSVVYA